MEHQTIISHLRSANAVAAEAMKSGHHPFGSVLIAPDGKEILLKQGNIDTLHHAETELTRRAYELYDPEFLWKCTLVTNFEPCAMCAGTIYWANIGTVIYGVEESILKELTGDHEENPTLALDCRTLFSKGQKDIKVIGPIKEVEDETLQLHKDFWK